MIVHNANVATIHIAQWYNLPKISPDDKKAKLFQVSIFHELIPSLSSLLMKNLEMEQAKPTIVILVLKTDIKTVGLK